jgi:hypothetical protein
VISSFPVTGCCSAFATVARGTTSIRCPAKPSLIAPWLTEAVVSSIHIIEMTIDAHVECS